MSVESDVQSGAHAAEAPAPAAPVGNPVPLALATFLPGALSLGLWLVGYMQAGDLGFIAPAVLFSTGLFLMICTIWAARLEANAVAAVLGTFAAFWLSLGVFIAAQTNGWLGFVGPAQATAASPASNPLPTFLVAWLIVFVLLTLGTLRLPLASCSSTSRWRWCWCTRCPARSSTRRWPGSACSSSVRSSPTSGSTPSASPSVPRP
jgi:uncharacterized protein